MVLEVIVEIVLICLAVICIVAAAKCGKLDECMPSGSVVPGLGKLLDIPTYEMRKTYSREDLEFLSDYAKHKISQCTVYEREDLERWIKVDRKIDIALYGW